MKRALAVAVYNHMRRVAYTKQLRAAKQHGEKNKLRAHEKLFRKLEARGWVGWYDGQCVHFSPRSVPFRHAVRVRMTTSYHHINELN